MTSPDKSHRVEVKDYDQTVAAAEVRTVDHPAGTIRTSLLPSSGHTPPGSRASLAPARGVRQLPGPIAGGFPAVGQGAPRADPRPASCTRQRHGCSESRLAGMSWVVGGLCCRSSCRPGSP